LIHVPVVQDKVLPVAAVPDTTGATVLVGLFEPLQSPKALEDAAPILENIGIMQI
jgi:hypothetical protein